MQKIILCAGIALAMVVESITQPAYGITGTVTDNATGKAIASAMVTRASDNMMVRSDAEGKFVFPGTSVIRAVSRPVHGITMLPEGKVRISLRESQFVVIERFFSNGRIAERIFSGRLSAGTSLIKINALTRFQGLSIIRLTLDGQSHVIRSLSVGGSFTAGHSGPSQSLSLPVHSQANLTAEVDTIYVWKIGYKVIHQGIDPGIDDYPVKLSTIAMNEPVAGSDLVFAQTGNIIAVEAECFFEQKNTKPASWYITHALQKPAVKPDIDAPHLDATVAAYVEVLPDSGHDGGILIHGVTFSDTGGNMAMASYKINVTTPGKYFVWARALGTDGDDNSHHYGIDGTWPDVKMWHYTGQKWIWACRHRSTSLKVFFDIKTAGEHVIHLSMREDGCEVDRFLLVNEESYAPPAAGAGPPAKAHKGYLPDFSLWK